MPSKVLLYMKQGNAYSNCCMMMAEWIGNRTTGIFSYLFVLNLQFYDLYTDSALACTTSLGEAGFIQISMLLDLNINTKLGVTNYNSG